MVQQQHYKKRLPGLQSRIVPSVVAEASIGVASSDAIVFCRLDSGVGEDILNGWLVLETRTALFVMIDLARDELRSRV